MGLVFNEEMALWRSIYAMSRAYAIAMGRETPPAAYYEVMGHDRHDAETAADTETARRMHEEGLRDASRHAGGGSWG